MTINSVLEGGVLCDIFALSSERTMKEHTFFRRIRTRIHLTQAEMADRMGISRTAYLKLENGETRIITDSVLKFCEASGVSLMELVSDCYPELSGGSLHEEADHEEAMRALRMEYEDRLERKDEEIASLRELAGALQHTVNVQEQMIGMLNRQSSKND